MKQMIFKRCEYKYILTQTQKKKVLEAMKPYMELDEYGRDIIRNIYYDTDNYRLIRRSIEKPIYKEKLRLRCYRTISEKDMVYVELKKKYESIVYKRRMQLPYSIAMECIEKKCPIPDDTQISREIDYFCTYYETLKPRVYISYEREAFYAFDGSDFRVTFDENIMYRTEALSLAEEPGGEPVLDTELTLMEIKCSSGFPMWMARCLSENKIMKTSFSKYGTAYGRIYEKNTDKERSEVK